MPETPAKITKQLESLQKKIDALDANPNALPRNIQLERLRLQKQILEHLATKACRRKLSLFEESLLTGTFFEEMCCFLDGKQRAAMYPAHRVTIKFSAWDEVTVKRLNKAGITDAEGLDAAVAAFEELVGKVTAPKRKPRRPKQSAFA